MTPKLTHLTRQLHEEGLTLREVGQRLGVSYQRAWEALKDPGEMKVARARASARYYRKKCGLPNAPRPHAEGLTTL